jgi:3-oxoacyl-[acyl-carrier-protein] synthase II
MMTAAGLELESSWQGVLQAQSPIKPFSLFDPGSLGASYGAELPVGAEVLFRQRLKPRRRKQMTRGTMIACLTAEMALADAGLEGSWWNPSRVGVVAGATGTGYAPPESRGDPHRILRNMANAPASWISLQHKIQGPSFVVSTACSSGAYALAAAHGLITSGLCDVVISGAADSSLSYPDVEGFSALMALSENAPDPGTASRPFDRARDGFVMGEGGGFLVLEDSVRARRRGARVYAELALPGLNCEAYNIMAPRPGGAGMVQAMQFALHQAGLAPDDIDYVNAHGTSTTLNDQYEVQAVREVFGGGRKVPFSSTKAVTGHCLAGAAGVEAVLCCLALDRQVIPPTANLADPDEGFDLDFVPLRSRTARLNHVMSNSFAFGGHNGVCIFSRG